MCDRHTEIVPDRHSSGGDFSRGDVASALERFLWRVLRADIAYGFNWLVLRVALTSHEKIDINLNGSFSVSWA